MRIFLLVLAVGILSAQVNPYPTPSDPAVYGSRGTWPGPNGNALIPMMYAAGGGTAQAQTATYAPVFTALATGLQACWMPTASNTASAPTFSPNGLTAKTIVGIGGVALVPGDLLSTAVACAIYDGTNWELQNPQSNGINQVTTTKPYTAFYTAQVNSLLAPTAVADVAGQIWYSQIFIPTTTTLTGACLFNGSGTLADKMIIALWNASGTVVANSALTGVTQSGTSQYQCQAFTGTVTVAGPQTYFVGVQGNATTAASLFVYPAGSAPSKYLTGSQSGAFGTIAAISSVASSFTAAVGPLMSVY